MIHYIIEWTNGAIDLLFGSNYINTLKLNDITPEIDYNTINYKII